MTDAILLIVAAIVGLALGLPHVVGAGLILLGIWGAVVKTKRGEW